MADIVVTWPKSKKLDSYLQEVDRAYRGCLELNFKVAQRPNVEPGERCYQVYDGLVVGWMPVMRVQRRERGEVDSVDGAHTWGAGIYIVRSPEWHSLPIHSFVDDLLPGEYAVPCQGFRGFRYATSIPGLS